MPTVEERVSAIETGIKKMDIDLKQHFTEMRAFVVDTVDGLEKRLGARFDPRFDALDARLTEVDTHLSTRLDGVDARLDGIDAPTERPRRQACRCGPQVRCPAQSNAAGLIWDFALLTSP
jgi:hypothetical protein